MKLEFIGTVDMVNDTDEVVLSKLLAAYQAIKDVKAEMRGDVEIKKVQRELDRLREPYKKRILRFQAISNAAELVARSRGILPPELEQES